MSTGMAFMVFTQSLFPAILLTVCNLIFVQILKGKLPALAPQADPAEIVEAGATRFRQTVAPEHLGGVLAAYATGARF